MTRKDNPLDSKKVKKNLDIPVDIFKLITCTDASYFPPASMYDSFKAPWSTRKPYEITPIKKSNSILFKVFSPTYAHTTNSNSFPYK